MPLLVVLNAKAIGLLIISGKYLIDFFVDLKFIAGRYKALLMLPSQHLKLNHKIFYYGREKTIFILMSEIKRLGKFEKQN